jgi:WD40 repeat protein
VLFGPTGVGKTSVLRAGVAYKLRQEAGVDVRIHSSWIGEPGEALASLTPSTGRDIYLMLDQFEEFFLYHEGDRNFVEELADLIRRPDLRVNVLIGIREDALALLDAFKAVIPNLLSNRLRLENLDRASGDAAIRGPLQRFNELVPSESRVDVEQVLVGAVLDEVAAGRVDLAPVGRGVVIAPTGDDRIEAPYLQLVMSRLWEVEAERGSKLLRRETLTELGGATQIVRDHLEHAMADLSPWEKDAAAAMFNFLVTPSGTKIAHRTRDLARYAEIEEQEAAEVLRRLAAERIVRASAENGAGTRYEIYHDVLADAVAGWGARYRAERFVHDAERRRRRAFGVATVALVGLIVVAAIAIFAVVERSHSQADAGRARAGELAADATIQLRVDPQKSLRLALAAARLDPGSPQQRVLRAAFIAARQRAVFPAPAPVEAALFEPDGKRLISAARDGKIRIYAAGTYQLERVLDQHSRVTATAVSAKDNLLLTGGLDGWARLWRTSDGMLMRRFSGGGSLRAALLDVRGNMVVTLAANGYIRTWRARDGRLVGGFRVRGKAIPKAAALDPRAQLLVTVAQDRFARVYRLRSGKLLRRLAQNGFVRSVAFSPDGRIILTSGYEGRARLWNAASGRMLRQLRGPDGSALGEAVFSPDGKYVAAAANDGTARIWETATGDAIGIAVGHAYQVTHVAFAPGDRGIVSASSDGTVKVWSIEGRLLSLLSGHTAAITSISFSPDGRAVLSASEDRTARLWDPWSEPELPVVARVKGVKSMTVTNGGKDVVVADGSSSIRVFHTTRNGLGSSSKRFGSVPPATVALSPDNRVKAVGNADGTVRLVDVHTNKLLRRLVGHTAAITSVAFSPDGRRLLTSSLDKDVRLWSVRSGKMLHLLRWHFGPVASAAFSPDGDWIVTAGPASAGLGLARTGERLLFLRGGTKPLVAAAFAGADGRLIVIARKDGTIRAWRCGFCGNMDELIELASQQLGSR